MEMSSYFEQMNTQTGTVEIFMLSMFLAGVVFALVYQFIPRWMAAAADRFDRIFAGMVYLGISILLGVGLWLRF